MENRFGFKDFFLTGLMIMLIVMVALAMVQFDRQWEVVQETRRMVVQQQEDLAQLRKDIAARPAGSGMAAAVPAVAAPAKPLGAHFTREEYAADPFCDLRAVYAQPDFAYGDSYVGAMPTRVKKLTPLVANDLYSDIISSYVLESLVSRDPETLEWRPYIAKDWSISSDGLTITFELREGPAFSDGSPVTAEDVKFSFDQVQRSDIQCPNRKPLYECFLSCETDGPRKVVFRLSKPYFQAFEAAAGLPILSKKWYGQVSPEDFNSKPGLLFGSGPYMLAGDPMEWTPGSGQITLVRNPRFWGPKAPLDKLVWRECPEDTTRLTEFRNGTVDSYSIVPDKYPEYSTDKQLLARGRLLDKQMEADGGYLYIAWNESREGGKPSPFADKRVRQAMTMLIDREKICREINNGIGPVACGPFSPVTKQSDPAIKPWPHDPARAKALLAEAGWTDRDGSGILANAKGESFRFKLLYPSGNAGVEREILLMRSELADAGIVMEPDPQAFDIILDRLDSRAFQAYMLGVGGAVEEDPRLMYHSESRANGGSNRIDYSNPELDRILDQARATMDEGARMELWHKAHRLLHEDQPVTFLFNYERVAFIDKRFKNYFFPKVGYINWQAVWVPKELQKK